MKEIDFQKAIDVAKEELKKIQIDATNINIEQAIISDNEKFYEITLSYEISLKDNLTSNEEKLPTNLQSLSMLLRKKRIYKTFLINTSNYKFRGFKIFK
ncbi:hypothetical protein [Aliarcobacter cryaerophilus]|uniref:hypothetical protein n=1 Tax=Aliarcobacter cryaerophilus TaxID=28198 RepID=UPI0021B6367C|nr:hypothetical protein [Aliarcobacter cryaerophilus]MCT7519032.1 hypothetical protein [Aliarcobacter cryaerophilus]